MHAAVKDERLSRARRLVVAIETGDEQAERELTDAIGRDHAGHLHRELDRIVSDLRETLGSVHGSAEIARWARRELPDAQLRLNQVIELTEAAAHRTLAAVEGSLPVADGITAAVRGFMQSGAGAASGDALKSLLASVVDDVGRLRQSLSDVLLAQSFQDITGQIIRRVAGLVADLEGLAGRASPVHAREATGEESACAGAPARTGEGPPLGAAVGQRDVDDLLAELGV